MLVNEYGDVVNLRTQQCILKLTNVALKVVILY